MRFTIPLIALAAIAAPLNAAVPMPAEEVVDVRIDVTGFDLSSAEGRASAEAMIDAELRKACTVESASPYRLETVDARCVANARADAIAQVERLVAAASRAGGTLAAN